MGTITKLYLKSILTSVSGHERDARASGGICLKNKILQWQSSKKIERTIKGLSVNFGCLI
jgi:hypothetical protein